MIRSIHTYSDAIIHNTINISILDPESLSWIRSFIPAGVHPCVTIDIIIFNDQIILNVRTRTLSCQYFVDAVTDPENYLRASLRYVDRGGKLVYAFAIFG